MPENRIVDLLDRIKEKYSKERTVQPPISLAYQAAHSSPHIPEMRWKKNPKMNLKESTQEEEYRDPVTNKTEQNSNKGRWSSGMILA